jgi:lipoprotein-anchoring transpeptidase ErfK/SrfK
MRVARGGQGISPDGNAFRARARGPKFPIVSSASNPLKLQSVSAVFFRLFVAAVLTSVARAQDPAPTVAVDEPRPVESMLEAQIELHRRGFSCGSIDGVSGPQTAAALRAFQRFGGIQETGALDAATLDLLRLTGPVLDQHTITAEELETLRPVPATWLEKSEQPDLPYATALELVAERHRASPALVRRLNPEIDWDTVTAGTIATVPAVDQPRLAGRVTQLMIRLEARELEGFDADSRVILHFPVSIARRVDKRPNGELHVKVVIRDPNFTFDPEVFPESEEGQQLGRKLVIPPGPNNPVGRAWIGLDLPGYGIHGTPDPEKVGRTESHGCFRLANWDAVTLLEHARVGMTVLVEP